MTCEPTLRSRALAKSLHCFRGMRGFALTSVSAALLAVAPGCDGDAELRVGVRAGAGDGAGVEREKSEREESSPTDRGDSREGTLDPRKRVGEGTSPAGLGSSGAADGGAGADCWQLPVIDAARLRAAPGAAASLVGGKIVGSNTSPMNGFVDLALIDAAPAEGEWIELQFDNATAYRFVKYYAPPGSHGALAELELYAGDSRQTGEGFGTAGSFEDQGNTFALALDGDPASFFQGPLPNDAYVGVDLGAGHVALAPTFSPPAGQFATAPTVTLLAEPGAQLLYTLDGSDPALAGLPYAEPLALPAASTLLRARATRDCMLPSETAQGVYVIGTANGETPTSVPGVQSSMHIGNSLTDTIVDLLPPLAQSGGILLDFNRYTIPGAGTWLYADNPTGGFGVENVQGALQTRPFDHLSMQPYYNLPCQVTPSSDGPDSDSGYVSQAWADARAQNPDVQLWIYEQWPEPIDFVNCLSGGGWTRGDWAPPAPADWEAAVLNEVAYQEALVAELMRLAPDAPRPYVVPGGIGLLNLKRAIEAGRVPGMTQFFEQIFLAQGTDVHLTRPGAYFITLIFYACMFQSDPAGTANDPLYEVTDEQASVLQAIAWETVTTYPASGVFR
jgi:hypothetical protein